MSQQWIAFAAVVVALLSLIVTVIVLVRKSGMEEGAIRARIKAVCQKVKTLREELLGRIGRVENDQSTAAANHREDVQRIFDAIAESDKKDAARYLAIEQKNEELIDEVDKKVDEQHGRLRTTMTMVQAAVMALMAVNKDIDPETIAKITSGGGFPD